MARQRWVLLVAWVSTVVEQPGAQLRQIRLHARR